MKQRIMIRRIVQKLRSEAFMRNIVLMLSGTGLAQLIPIIISPILTRCYGQAEFSAFGAFLAFVSIMSVMATLRYSQAIITRSDHESTSNIFYLSLFLSIGFSLTLLIVLPFLRDIFSQIEGVGILGGNVYLVPFSGLLMAVNLCLYAFLNWRKKYQEMARGKVFQGMAAGILAILLGVPLVGIRDGLIYSFVGGQIFYLVYLVLQNKKEIVSGFRSIKPEALMAVGREEYRFPMFALPADLLNACTAQVPLLMLIELCGEEAGGYYSLTYRVLVVPISFVAVGVLDVFRKEASEAFSKTGNCLRITQVTCLGLFAFGICLFSPVALVGPKAFEIVFGEGWRESGVFAAYLSIFFVMRLAASPTSYVFYITGRQRTDLCWQVVLFIGSVFSIRWGAESGGARSAVLIYSVFYSVMYLIYVGLIIHAARGDRRGGSGTKNRERV